jgi:hypothetical protein
MAFSNFLVAAAAAAQAAAPQGHVDPAQAQAAGYAQAQAALSGQGLSVSPSSPLPVAAPAPAGNAILRSGTEIPLRLEEELTTKGKQLRVGQRFHLTTTEPVIVNGVNVIPVGTPAEGEVTDVRNKGMWGKSGHLAARILYMTLYGRQIRLSGTFDEKGSAGGVGAVAVSAFVFLPAGFFMTGTSAKVPAGTVVKSFLGEDVPLAMPAIVQGPLPVPAPAAPMQVQAAAPLTEPAKATQH